MPECAICHTLLEVRDTRRFCPACLLRDLLTEDEGDPLETQITPMPMAPDLPKVPRFHLIEKLGEGGFAVVYRALQKEPVRRDAAVKVLKAQVATEHVLARFETERQTLARMEHPGIARLWDAGRTEEGQPFFAMELVRGEPITSYCKLHGLGLPERLELFIAVCEAVQHAHEKGVLHRDLKPSNILAYSTEDGGREAKIIDFGIAKALEVTHDDETTTGPITSLHQTVGTPGYMSPEQSAWGANVVDARSDLYALGVVLYELITGFTPLQIERRTSDEARHWPVAKHITAPSKLANNLLQTKTGQRDVDAIVLKALETDSARRYASAAALAEDVRRHLDDEPVLAGETSWTYVMEKFARRHRSLVVSAAVALVSIFAGLAVSTLMFFKEQHARAQAEESQRELQRTLSRADYLVAQQFKNAGDAQSAVACLTRALRYDPEFKAAGADLQMMLVQDDTPQPVETVITIDPEWGEAMENAGAVSAGGHVLAVTFQTDNRQRLMHFRHGSSEWQQRELPLQARVSVVEVAASGNLLAVAEEDHHLRLCKGTDLTCLLDWKAPAMVTALAVAAVNEVALAGCADGSVWFLDTRPDQAPKRVGSLKAPVSHLRFALREQSVVAACKNGELWLLAADGAIEAKLLLHMPGEITAVSMPSNGLNLVVGDSQGHVAGYGIRKTDQMPVTKLHDSAVTAVTLGSNLGKTVLLSAGGTRDLRVRWTDLATRSAVKPPLESAGAVKRIVMTRTIDSALVVNADASVRVWRQAGEGAVTVRKPQRARFVAMSTQGRCMAVRRDLGKSLEVLLLPQDPMYGTVLDDGGPTPLATFGRSCSAFGADGKTLVVANERGVAALWDTDFARAAGVARWQSAVLAMAATPAGTLLAAKADGSLIEVPMDGGPAITRLAAEPGVDWTLGSVSPDGLAAVWATSSPEMQRTCRVRFWRAVDGKVRELSIERLASIAVHGGTDSVAFGLGNGHVRVLRGEEDERGVFIPLHQSSVSSIAFNKDGSALLTGSTDRTAAVWETKRLTPLTDGFRLGEPVRRVVFSGDGLRFACVAENRVFVGDLKARGLIGQAIEMPFLGQTLALNHAGTRVAFSIGNGSIFVHDIAPPPATPAPAWFLSLADMYVSRRMTPQGTIEIMDHPGLAALRQLPPGGAGDDEWQRFARWMFTHTGLRQLTPWSPLTMEDYVKEVEKRPMPTKSIESRRLRTLRYHPEEMGEPLKKKAR